MTDYEIVDVTKLQKAEGVKDGDTLLLIRQQGDGTSICMRTDGAQFKGTDAYDVAKANGFSGTREEWTQEVARINEVSAAIDNANDTASHPTKIGSDNYVYEWNKAAKAYQKTGILVKGDKGETGATGATGPQGATGAQGPQGERGENGKSPIIQNASWWIWDEASGAYKDSGMSVSSQYTLTKEGIESVLTGDVSSHSHSAYALTTHTHSEYAAVNHTHDNYYTKAEVDGKGYLTSSSLDGYVNEVQSLTMTDSDNMGVSDMLISGNILKVFRDRFVKQKTLLDYVRTENLGTAIDEYAKRKEYLTKEDLKETVIIKLVSDKSASDTNLNGAKVTVKSGDTTVSTQTWQGTPIKVEVPCDKEVTIDAAAVKMYAKPKVLKYVPSPLYNRDVTFTYKALETGVFIIDKNDKTYKTAKEFTDSGTDIKDVIGTLLVTDNAAIVVANYDSEQIDWGPTTLVDGCTVAASSSEAAQDFAGAANTAAIIETYGLSPNIAAAVCYNYIFGNGRRGHLMSAGEGAVIQRMCPDIYSLMSSIGINSSSIINSNKYYWTSTQKNASSVYRYFMYRNSPEDIVKGTINRVIPIYSLYD